MPTGGGDLPPMLFGRRFATHRVANLPLDLIRQLAPALRITECLTVRCTEWRSLATCVVQFRMTRAVHCDQIARVVILVIFVQVVNEQFLNHHWIATTETRPRTEAVTVHEDEVIPIHDQAGTSSRITRRMVG